MREQGGKGLVGERLRWSRRSLLLAGLLVAGCGKQGRPTIESEDNTSEDDATKQALREILDRRAAAVKEKNEAAFLADLDQSNAKLIQQEKALFANLSQFKFKEFRYITDKILLPTEENGGFSLGPVIQIAQLPVDDGPGGVAPGETYKYMLVKNGDKLVVSNIAGAGIGTQENGLDGPPADAPWHFGPLKVIEAGNVWLAADATVPDLDKYAAAAEREAHWAEALWGNRLRFPGHALFFTKDPQNLKNWYGFGSAGNYNADIEGFQHAMMGVRKDGSVYQDQYAGARVVVNLKSIGAFNDDPAIVMRHELVHAVSSRARTSITGFAGLGAPTWAVEGFARYAEGIDNASAKSRIRGAVASGVGGGKFNGKLPLSKTFYDFGGAIDFNYNVSSTIFSYIEKTKDRNTAVEFYSKVIEHIDEEGAPFTETPAFQGICERILGKSNGAFLEQWAGYVRGGV